MCNGKSVIHGGALMAFADTLGAAGTVINLPEGHATATIESKTNFIAGAPEVRADRRGDAGPSRAPDAGLADADHAGE